MSSTAAAVHGATMRFRGHTALDSVSVAIEENTITGLLGRNGAGKTTLMQLMAGHLVPTSGRIEVFGANPYENESVLQRLCLVLGVLYRRFGARAVIVQVGVAALSVCVAITGLILLLQDAFLGYWLNLSPGALFAGGPLILAVVFGGLGYLGSRRVVP